MLPKPRRQRSFRTKLIGYVLFLTILGLAVFLTNSFFLNKKPLFISPIGENNIDIKKVEEILKDKNILFSQVLISPDSSYEIVTSDSGRIKLSAKKDIEKQIASLQRILRELTIEGKSFKSLDFRFEEPIISL